jgi:hypothetical protein
VDKINSFEIVHERYQWLAEKTQTAIDIQEKNLLQRRRINLLSVMEFILSETRRPN